MPKSVLAASMTMSLLRRPNGIDFTLVHGLAAILHELQLSAP